MPDMDEVMESLKPSEEEPLIEFPPEPPLIITKNAFGPGTWAVRMPDGLPVGIFIAEEGMGGDEVREFLEHLELTEDLTEFFARNREKAIATEGTTSPAMQSFAESERRHEEKVSSFREQFLKAQKK